MQREDTSNRSISKMEHKGPSHINILLLQNMVKAARFIEKKKT